MLPPPFGWQILAEAIKICFRLDFHAMEMWIKNEEKKKKKKPLKRLETALCSSSSTQWFYRRNASELSQLFKEIYAKTAPQIESIKEREKCLNLFFIATKYNNFFFHSFLRFGLLRFGFHFIIFGESCALAAVLRFMRSGNLKRDDFGGSASTQTHLRLPQF